VWLLGWAIDSISRMEIQMGSLLAAAGYSRAITNSNYFGGNAMVYRGAHAIACSGFEGPCYFILDSLN
jgi:hypothetical protein